MGHKRRMVVSEQVAFARDCAGCYMGPCESVGVCGSVIPAPMATVASHRDPSYLSKRLWAERHYEDIRTRQRQTNLGSNGRSWTGLHKRPYPDGVCELCGKQVVRMHYHHWDDDNPGLGLWLCPACHRDTEGMDRVLDNPDVLAQYANLKATASR